jgi:hypothetical protein
VVFSLHVGKKNKEIARVALNRQDGSARKVSHW